MVFSVELVRVLVIKRTVTLSTLERHLLLAVKLLHVNSEVVTSATCRGAELTLENGLTVRVDLPVCLHITITVRAITHA